MIVLPFIMLSCFLKFPVHIMFFKRSQCSFYVILHQAMCRDSRTVPGAAATEIELAKRLKEFSLKETGYLFNPSLYPIFAC